MSVDAYAALRSWGIERGAKGRLWAPRSPLDDPSSLSLAIAPARSIRGDYGFGSQVAAQHQVEWPVGCAAAVMPSYGHGLPVALAQAVAPVLPPESCFAPALWQFSELPALKQARRARASTIGCRSVARMRLASVGNRWASSSAQIIASV